MHSKSMPRPRTAPRNRSADRYKFSSDGDGVRHRLCALRDEPNLSALRRELATRVGVARVRHAHETALATLWKGFVKVLVAALQDVRVGKRERGIRSHVISSIQVSHVSPHARCAFAAELAVKHVHYVCARRRARREKFLHVGRRIQIQRRAHAAARVLERKSTIDGDDFRPTGATGLVIR